MSNDVGSSLSVDRGCATTERLAPSQCKALKADLSNRAVVIMGGPGVDKTTFVNRIRAALPAKAVKCLLYGPRGRTVKRLTETTSLEAKTMRRSHCGW